MRRKLKPYTVVGVNGVNLQRCSIDVYAMNSMDAESEAYAENPDLLIAAVFEGKVISADTRAHAAKYSVGKQ